MYLGDLFEMDLVHPAVDFHRSSRIDVFDSAIIKSLAVHGQSFGNERVTPLSMAAPGSVRFTLATSTFVPEVTIRCHLNLRGR